METRQGALLGDLKSVTPEFEMWNKAQPHEAMPMLNTAVVKRSGRESRHTLALQGIPLLGNRDASFPRTLYFHRVWMNFGISPCTSVNIYFKGQSQVIHILTYSKISHTPTIFKWAVSCVKYIHIIVQWISRRFSSYKTETLYLLNTNNSLTLHFFLKVEISSKKQKPVSHTILYILPKAIM